MSASSRILSGSLASWANMVVNLFMQVVLVPVYLTFWGVDTYAVWLTALGIQGIFQTIERSYHIYLGNVFVQLVHDRPQLSRAVGSGLLFGLLLAGVQCFLALVLVRAGVMGLILDHSARQNALLMQSADSLLMLQMVTCFLTVSLSGILNRVLNALGHYPRTSWWLVGWVFISGGVPALVVCLGGGLLTAGLALSLATLLYYAPVYADQLRILRREGVQFNLISWQTGWTNLSRSLVLALKELLDYFRQQGLRMLIAPMAGAAALVSFTTLRTGSNVATQGLNTIVTPLMHELLRYIKQRDQDRIEASFSMIWLVLMAVLAPAVLLLQVWMEPLFEAWTRGRVQYDPVLFATLSISVLVLALYQPALAVLSGNNLVKQQLSVTAIVSGLLIGGLFWLVPRIGIVGAGVGVLFAELATSEAYRLMAARWLGQHDLRWPARSYWLAARSVSVVAGAVACMILLPQSRYYVLIMSEMLLFTLVWQYWKLLPPVATQGVERVASKVMHLKLQTQRL